MRAMSNDRDERRRQTARRDRRNAGDRSARVALQLMKVKESTLGKLGLDDELRAVIDTARGITSQVARRRAERNLAGELRRIDLTDLQKKLASVEATGTADTQLFHLAESWRNRLVEEGLPAAETFPGGAAEPLPTLIQKARSERDTQKPPGAGRALFRHVMATLTAQQEAAEDAATSDSDNDDNDSDSDDD
jgi:ribosomal 50S subunit-associated protein YjgA (DUF615 family)